MALQNIGASNRDDAFYRYKMPKMITKIEGRGNGIKTNIVNNIDIAKALARPPSYTIKYFGCELGAQSKFDEKTGMSHVNGAHDTSKLAGLLEDFIKKYVQCYGCGNPETEVIVTKTQMIQLKCAACGFISGVDMRDKLTTFILKHPPEIKKGKDKKSMRRAEVQRVVEGATADEEQRKQKKGMKKKTLSKDGAVKTASFKKKASGSDEDHGSPHAVNARKQEEVEYDDDDDGDVQWQTDTSMEAARQQIQEQLNAVTASMVMLSTNEKEKKAKTVDKAHGDPKSPSDHAAAENGHGTHKILVQEIEANIRKGATAKQFQSFMGSLSGSAQEVMTALYEALLVGVEKGFAKEVAKRKNYIAAAVAQDVGSQLLLLRAVEEFTKKSNSSAAVKEVALVLKVLYDADILEEEYIVKWYEQGLSGSSKDSAIWKNAKPFVEWLQNAESETGEE